MRRLGWLILAVACSKAERVDQPPPAHEDRHEPAIAQASKKLDVTIDGVAATWNRDVFDRAPLRTGTARDGEARETWSLRELARQNAGPTARVVAVVGNIRETIDAAAWNDATRTPIIHGTKRGTLKFRWEDRDGKWGATEVNDVSKLEIVR
jgi:hypothetical protein